MKTQQQQGSPMESSAMYTKKKITFPPGKVKKVDYKNVELIRQFITERGKILPRRITGASHQYQKLLKKAIKQARYMALLPFVSEE